VSRQSATLNAPKRAPSQFPPALSKIAPELLDPAAARPFLSTVRFRSMTADQIAEAYRRAFGTEAPGSVLKLSGLTPADFATVVKEGDCARLNRPLWKRRLTQ
jgi:hypothetical protein